MFRDTLSTHEILRSWVEQCSRATVKKKTTVFLFNIYIHLSGAESACIAGVKTQMGGDDFIFFYVDANKRRFSNLILNVCVCVFAWVDLMGRYIYLCTYIKAWEFL